MISLNNFTELYRTERIQRRARTFAVGIKFEFRAVRTRAASAITTKRMLRSLIIYRYIPHAFLLLLTSIDFFSFSYFFSLNFIITFCSEVFVHDRSSVVVDECLIVRKSRIIIVVCATRWFVFDSERVCFTTTYIFMRDFVLFFSSNDAKKLYRILIPGTSCSISGFSKLFSISVYPENRECPNIAWIGRTINVCILIRIHRSTIRGFRFVLIFFLNRRCI